MAFKANLIKSSFLVVLICFSTFYLHTSTEACHITDRAALLDFKSKITSDPMGLLQTWNQSTDCCIEWEGVACDRHGRVASVTRRGSFSTDDTDWINTNMSGTISPSLGKLKFLRYLDLGSLRYLEGSIPSELGNLSHLITLYLNSNNLKGSIPASFQNLRKLKILNLNQNRLSGTVPTNVFQHMSSLTTLILNNNKLSGQIPSSIDKLVSVQWFYIDLNNFSGSIPSTIGSLNKLVSLDLSQNQFSGSIPTSIGELSELEELYLGQNRLTGSIPSSFTKLTFLRSCSLGDNKLSGSIPASIGNNTALRELFLYNNMLTGKLPKSIGNLTNLGSLDLSNNMLTGALPVEFEKLASGLKLYSLDLHSNNFTGGLSLIFPKDTSHSNNFAWGLEFMDLSYNKFVGRIDNINIGNLEGMQMLETLDLSNNHLGGSIPKSLGKLGDSLNILKLEKNRFTGSIPSVVINLKKLVKFNVSYNKLTGKIPIHKTRFPAASFLGNSGLCGSPLPPCKTTA